MSGYMTIQTWYKLNSKLSNKYKLSEIEAMYPYERDLYTAILSEEMEQQDRINGST